MAEVTTAPIAKNSSKAASKASKHKPSIQTKTELTGSREKQIQPFLINTPIVSAQSGRKNSAALSGLWKNSVHTKLKVGQPGDKYEQEADAIADKVVSSPATDISRQQNEELPDPKPSIQGSGVSKELQPSLKDEPEIQESSIQLHMQPEEEPDIQALPDETSETGELLQTSVMEDDEAGEVQTKDGDGMVSSGFESKLSEAKSGGSPLPQSTINKVEPHVNADLSGVRVHTGSKAVELNQSLGSQAFANQNHIFFNEGKYNPGTTSGDHLIAHEATHTVQQGASVKKKPVEEDAPEEVQMKEDKPVSDNQQTAAPPATPPSPDDTNPNANPGGSVNNTGTSGDHRDQNSSNHTDTGNNNPASPPPVDTSGDKSPLPPKEDLQKENPITQRAAEYKEEEVAQVKALSMEGNSEQAMASFTGAGASQVAMAFPTMGDTLNQKLGSEKQKAASEAPKLTAGTTGVKDQKTQKATDPGQGKSADLKDGVTESEPAAPQLEPHQEGTPLPTHQPDTRLDEGKPAKEESGGFFSWLFDKFKNIMGAVKTVDQGLNTKAGASPKIDTKGRANPDRAENQSQEGKNQVNKEKQEAAREINNNPGQQNVQPLFFEEPKEVIIDTTVQNTAATAEDQAMADFVNLPLPESVRTQTDLDLAPKMEKSLAKPRQDTQVAAQKRDTDKQAAIKEKQVEAEKMNKAAEKEQQDLVTKNREVIAAEQKRGVDEAETQMNAFSTEADKEKARANKDVKARIKKDQDEGEKKLKAAESEAAIKKKEGEAEAKAEKEAAKKNSKKKSWWGKFKDAVSSAVSWVTEKIGKIFDKIRKAVKFIIDKAKKAALALIEAGRKWIIDKLDKFGNWLKEKANKYLKHFPALRKRVNAFIDKTVDGAKKLVNKVADGLKKGVEALADALGKAINSVLNAFEGVLKAAVQFAGAMLKGDFAEALKIAFMATCKVAGIDPTPILNFINKAGETIGLIFKNPAAFFSNVAGGVKLGINQFVKNIKKHLISGLISWLTGAMSDVPIQMPEKFDLKGIFSLVMQILGLTYDRIRAKVVKRIGPKGEQIVSGMEKTFQFVKDLITKGPIVIWERIKDKFNEIKEMAMDKIRNLVTIEVVKAGIKWIIGLLNPASAIVKAVLMLYDFVMFLIERKDQIIGFVTAVFDTVGPLARGQIKKAGNAVEGAMGRGVPVILGLLANLAGLGGIGKSVSKVIKTIQKPVDKVVDPVIGWLVKQGKKLWKKGKDGARKLKDKVLNFLGLKKLFKSKDGHDHKIFFKGGKLTVASTPVTLYELIKREKESEDGIEKGDLNLLEGYLNQIDQIRKSNVPEKDKVDDIDAIMKQVATVLGRNDLEGKDMHKPTGDSQNDPIYIHWYKDQADYAQITITDRRGTQVYQPGNPVPIWDTAKQMFLQKPLHLDLGNFKKKDQFVKKHAFDQSERKSTFRTWSFRRRASANDGRSQHEITDGTVDATTNQQVRLDLGNKLANSWQLDHVRGLRVGGPDAYNNLWPIKTSDNDKANDILQQYVIHQGESKKLGELPGGTYVKASKTISVRAKHGTDAASPFKGTSGEESAVDSQMQALSNSQDLATDKLNVRSGKGSDPIPIIWNKTAGDFPTVGGKNIQQKVDLGDDLIMQVNHNFLSPKGKWMLEQSHSRTQASKFRKAIVTKANAGAASNEDQVKIGSTTLQAGKAMDRYVAFDHVLDLAFGGDDAWSNVWIMRADKNDLAKSNSDQFVAVAGETKAISVKNQKLLNKHMKIIRQTGAKAHGTSPDNPAGKEELTKIKPKS